MKRIAGLHSVMLVSAAALAALAPQAGSEELFCLSHSQGRVAIHLPLDGSLGMCLCAAGEYGIRWPGRQGTEFLGTGGIFLRFRAPGEPDLVSLEPGRLEPLFAAADGLNEGCEGGKRYPHPERDDDRDGYVDEDPVDGIDNDGDGSVDEDFAAYGSDMKVTRAVDRRAGLVVQQSSYTWSFGHVRDIVGFTTVIQCMRGDRRGISELQAALYTDFRIGDGDDPGRGKDDRHFFIEVAAATGNVRAAVTAGGQNHVALVPLEVRGPGGIRSGMTASLLAPTDSLWAELVPRTTEASSPFVEMLAADGEPEYTKGFRFTPSTLGDLLVTSEIRGEMAAACLTDPVRTLGHGEELQIDWALVFGKSMPALLRNVRRAAEMYAGVFDEDGLHHKWVVPARRAVRIELQARPTFAWSQGRRQAAAAILLPPEIEDEEVEWLRAVNGEFIEYQQAGGKLIVMIGDPLSEGDWVVVEGQLTDGTVFTAKLDAATLQGIDDDGRNEDNLPDESIQLYPNPFLTSLNINLRIYEAAALASEDESESSVKIYDVRGRLVKTVLEQEMLHPGEYLRVWDGYDEHGKEAAPGVYYVKLQIGDRSVTKRVILLR